MELLVLPIVLGLGEREIMIASLGVVLERDVVSNDKLLLLAATDVGEAVAVSKPSTAFAFTNRIHFYQ